MRIAFEREAFQSLGLDLPSMSEVVAARRLQEVQESKLRAREHRRQARSYQGGKVNRLTSEMPWNNLSQRGEITRYLRILRAHSRHLARNNDYFIKFLRMCRRNVIGPDGMRLQAIAKTPRGKPDAKLNQHIEEQWARWSRPKNASSNCRLSWREIQLRWITILARDGEIFMRKIAADNPYGFALKIIDANWFDEMFNQMVPGGNRIIMSVEVDPEDRVVGYWLTPPGDEYFGGIMPLERRRYRVPAEEIYHYFLPFDENAGDDTQTRGVPWAHAAMIKLWMLGSFEEAAVIAARIGASKMGFYTETVDELTGTTGGNNLVSLTARGDQDDDDKEPELLDHVEPGHFSKLPAGVSFEAFTPEYPSAMVEPFDRIILRGIAAGLGPAYFSFASDLREVNFSSARIGLEEERDDWRVIQGCAEEHLYQPVHEDWLRSGMMTGALNIQPPDIDRLCYPKISARGWKYLEPVKDAQATILRINNGLGTRTQDLAEQGLDYEETIDQLSDELQYAKDKEVPFTGDKPAAADPAADSTNNPNDKNADKP